MTVFVRLNIGVMKARFEDGKSDLILIIIMTVFVRSNIAKFGQYAQFPKKNILLAPKNENDQKNE